MVELQKELSRAYYDGLKREAGRIHQSNRFNWDQSFETAGCTCTPLRARVAELKTAIEEKAAAQLRELQATPEWQERAMLLAEVQAIDRQEHHRLDQEGAKAASFFRLWYLENAEELLDKQDAQTIQRYAEAWVQGWRPTKAKEVGHANSVGSEGSDHGSGKD